MVEEEVCDWNFKLPLKREARRRYISSCFAYVFRSLKNAPGLVLDYVRFLFEFRKYSFVLVRTCELGVPDGYEVFVFFPKTDFLEITLVARALV